MPGGGDIGGGIGGAIGGIVGLATMGKGGEREAKKRVKLWEMLQQPDFDYRELSPPELRMVAEYFPETYEAVVPESVRLTEDSPWARGQQADAVGRLGTYAKEGLPLSERLNAQGMQLRLAGEAGSIDDSIRRNLAARGRLGGGTEAAMRQGSSQVAANLARDMGSDLTQQAIENRYRANLAAGEQAGNLRQGDINLSSNRANAVNRFNEMVADLRNQAARDNWSERTAAQRYNVGTRQGLANENARSRYGVGLENLNRKNALKQGVYDNDVTKLRGQSEALAALSGAKYDEQAARLQNITSIGQGVGQAGGSLLGGFF